MKKAEITIGFYLFIEVEMFPVLLGRLFKIKAYLINKKCLQSVSLFVSIFYRSTKQLRKNVSFLFRFHHCSNHHNPIINIKGGF